MGPYHDGPKVRKARKSAADAHEGGMFSCTVILLLHFCLTSGVGFRHARTRGGISLARSVEFTAQWDEILGVGPVHPLDRVDFELAFNGGLGQCRRVVGDLLHCRLSDFIHKVVVHRRDEATRGWWNWLREDPPCSSLQVAQA